MTPFRWPWWPDPVMVVGSEGEEISDRVAAARPPGFSLLGEHCIIPKSRAKEVTMATQIVMDHTGDTRHRFDPADAAAVAKAEARFKKLTGEGFTAAMRLGDGKSKVLKSFDPTAEETLFIPRLQGG
jgi:hypothetical protein